MASTLTSFLVVGDPMLEVMMTTHAGIYKVLAWRYLATSCKQEDGNFLCTPAQFGVIVPQDRLSMKVSLTPVGKEKLKIKGAERELLRLNLKDDSGEWALWLDDQYKLMRILVAADNTEVVRD